MALAYQLTEAGPQFMVIDADQRPCAGSDLIDRRCAGRKSLGSQSQTGRLPLLMRCWNKMFGSVNCYNED